MLKRNTPSKHKKTQRNFKCILLSKEVSLKRFCTAWLTIQWKQNCGDSEIYHGVGIIRWKEGGIKDGTQGVLRERRFHPTLYNPVMMDPWHYTCQNPRIKAHPSLNANGSSSRAWWLMPVIPVFGKLRQKGLQIQGKPGLHQMFQAKSETLSQKNWSTLVYPS